MFTKYHGQVINFFIILIDQLKNCCGDVSASDEAGSRLVGDGIADVVEALQSFLQRE